MEERMKSKLWKALISVKLAVYLIIFLGFSSILGMIVPQSTFNVEAYQAWSVKYSAFKSIVELLSIDRVFYSPWFLTAVGIFTLNLICCTVERTRIAYMQYSLIKNRKILRHNARLDDLNRGINVEFISNKLRKTGFKEYSHSNSKVFIKHPSAIFISPIFHSCFILVVLGALITFLTSMTGYMMVAENDIRADLPENYRGIEKGVFFREHSGLEINLEKLVRHSKADGTPDYVESHIAIYEDGKLKSRGQVSFGFPFSYRQMRIFHFDSGYAPLITLKNQSGQLLYQGFLVLETIDEEPGKLAYVARETPVAQGITIDGNYKPEEGSFVFSVSEQGREYEGNARKGSVVSVGPYQLSVDDVINWTGFQISNDPGAFWLFAGAWMASFALIAFLVVSPKQVILYLDEVGEVTYLEICTNGNKKGFLKEIEGLLSNVD